jgi:hypothetical protein
LKLLKNRILTKERERGFPSLVSRYQKEKGDETDELEILAIQE